MLFAPSHTGSRDERGLEFLGLRLRYLRWASLGLRDGNLLVAFDLEGQGT